MLVRLFSPHDVAFAASLSSLEGMTAARDDEHLTGFDPHACFVGEIDGEPMGMVLAVCYGKLGWISALVIKRPHRGHGYGRLLLDTAVAYLLDHGARTVGLDAPADAVGLCREAGFVPAFDIVYLRGPQGTAPAAEPASVSPFRARDLHAVAMFDWACFGASREWALRALLQLSQVAFLAQDEAGLAGYLLARRLHDHWTLGPWVCSRLAGALLGYALDAIGPGAVQVGVPEVNEPALALLGAHGFAGYYRETRLYQGNPEGIGQPEHIYAIAGSEQG